MRVRGAAGVMAGVAIVGLVLVADPRVRSAEAPGGVPSAPPSGTSATDAVARARALGRRVELVAQRSETGQVFANPNGTFTLQESPVPLRVRRGAGWVPVDATLQQRGDGTVAPRAVPPSLAFSGGGSGTPLVRLASGGKQLALRWPAALPAPVLAGDTATYREVLPGVDLRLRALPRGFSEVLVVKDRAAARNPRLAALRFGISTTGVSLRADKQGNLGAYDKAGKLVFGSGAALLWDSATAATAAPAPRLAREPGVQGQAPSADAPGAASRQAVGKLELAAGQLIVRPDATLLANPATTFPLFIDPGFQAGGAGWTLVLEGVSQPKWNGANDTAPVVAKSGFSNWDSPTVRYRTYFQYDTGRALGTHVLGASFRALEVYAPSCGARSVEAWATTRVDPNTNWGNQPFWSANKIFLGGINAAAGYSGGCPATWLEWNALAAVQGAVAGGSWSTTIMLKAADEGDRYAWKKFDVGANYPVLSVDYNSIPNAPTNLSANNKGCAVEPNEPYSDDPSPTLRAVLSDPDGGLVHAQFEWWVRFGGLVGNVETAAQSSGDTVAATIPDGAFGNGAKIAYRVRTGDYIDWGPWSNWCDVTVDQTPPDQPPTVSSTSYPECDLGGGIGQTGAFTFGANGVGDVAGFVYDLHDQPQTFVAANAAGGSATALVTPPDDSPTDLFVRSVDRAGNLGPVYHSPCVTAGGYHFLVGAGTPPVAQWRLDGWGDTAAAPDGSGHGHDGTVVGMAPASGAAWDTGRVDHALRFDGATGQVTTAGGQAVDATRTFSVSAWVKLNGGSGFRSAVSQDAGAVSGFYLQVTPDNHWAMSRPDSRAVAPDVARLGVWTHLVGTFDQGSRQWALWVDGVRAATNTADPVTGASGPLRIGAARWDGGVVDFFPGTVDDVRVYDRLLSAAEIHDLATTPTVEEAFLPLDEGSGTAAADVSGNLRNATLRGGATWVRGKKGTGAVQLDGGSGAAVAAGPAVRTDASFTVSALVKADVLDAAARTAVSQDGGHASGFYLQYRGDSGRWTFLLPDDDSDGTGGVVAQAPATEPTKPVAGEWTGLTGVYDAAAREIRLYVNGALAARAPYTRARWNAAGPLAIGRAWYNTQAVDWWRGAVDDVHVWSGVRTGDQIRADFRDTATQWLTVYTGQFNRWLDHAGHHLTGTTGVAPDGYHFEASLGLPAPASAAGTKMLSNCLFNGVDWFTSADPACEGQRVMGQLGLVYASKPAGVPTTPLYRCQWTHGHFDSNDAGCEGQTVDGLLGYARADAFLIRFVQRDPPGDHWSTFALPGPGYWADANLGVIALSGEPGVHGVMSCIDGGDHFTSLDEACEGKQVQFWTGNVWTAPPADGRQSQPLYRCRTSPGGERFDSIDPGCEGQTVDRQLGYVVTQL